MQGLIDQAFTEPFRRLAELFVNVISPFISVLVILVVGGLLAYLARIVVQGLLQLVHFDRLASSMGLTATLEHTPMFRSPSEFGARCVQGFVWLIIILLALSAAGTMTEDLVVRFVNYIPDLVAAALVLLLGSLVSKFLARSALLAAVNAQWQGARLIAGGVRFMVMLLAVVIALEQLRIGRTALLTAFAILFGGIVVAGAIAFGFGARDMVREWLQSKMKPREKEEEEVFRHL